MNLKVFENDHPEWWVARDLKHLHELLEGPEGERIGMDPFDPEDWMEVNPETPLTMWLDEDGSRKETKTAREWATQEGPGFLMGVDR
jgi:hypothetical protein